MATEVFMEDDDYLEVEEYSYPGYASSTVMPDTKAEESLKLAVVKNIKLGQKGKNLFLTSLTKLSEKNAYKCLKTIIEDKKNSEVFFYEASYEEHNETLIIQSDRVPSLKKWRKYEEKNRSYKKIGKELFTDIEKLSNMDVRDIPGQISLARIIAYNQIVLEAMNQNSIAIVKKAQTKIAKELGCKPEEISLTYDYINKIVSAEGIFNAKKQQFYFANIDDVWVVAKLNEIRQIGFAAIESAYETNLSKEILKTIYKDLDKLKNLFDENELLINLDHYYTKSSNSKFRLNINIERTELLIPDHKEMEEFKLSGIYNEKSNTRPFSLICKPEGFCILVNDKNKKTEEMKYHIMSYVFTQDTKKDQLFNNILFKIDDMPYWIQSIEEERLNALKSDKELIKKKVK